MPSALHEAIVELFRHRPVLAAELLHEALRVPLPRFRHAGIDSATFSDLEPPEYHADLVVRLADEEAPVLGIVVEVQLGIDAQKRFSWPHYAASLRARMRCPTCVLVYAPDPAVARWAADAVACGPGWALQPFVLGPDGVPLVADPEQALARPELAVLSVVAHGRRLPPVDAAALAANAVQAFMHQDDRPTTMYYDLVIDSLSLAAREAFAMNAKSYEYKTEFARRYVAEGKADAVLQVLAARGLSVPEAIRQRVRACQDPLVLDRWIERAALARSAAEVVESDS